MEDESDKSVVGKFGDALNRLVTGRPITPDDGMAKAVDTSRIFDRLRGTAKPATTDSQSKQDTGAKKTDDAKK